MFWETQSIVAHEEPSGRAFLSIDFNELEPTHLEGQKLVIKLKLTDRIYDFHPKTNRCCKFNGRKLKYDNIDNMERVSCNISRKIFHKKFVSKRKAVLLTGCQNGWKAKDWTFGNLLGRYLSKWAISYYHQESDDCYTGYVEGPKIFHMMKNKTKVKSITRIRKSLRNILKDG